MRATKAMRFPIDMILVCIRCYAAYPLSYRHLEEIMQERSVPEMTLALQGRIVWRLAIDLQ